MCENYGVVILGWAGLGWAELGWGVITNESCVKVASGQNAVTETFVRSFCLFLHFSIIRHM